MAQTAPTCPEIPSQKRIRNRLHTTVKERQEDLLRRLPAGSKISIALDCWTSPFSQAFMAISGYFIDEDWQYREILLGFEPLYGTHSGANLSVVLLEILQRHKIEDRVLAVVTDNASNNKTLVDTLQQSMSDDITLIRVPCIAHVIQLSLNELLGSMKADPMNETTEARWTEQRSQSARMNAKHHRREIVRTLNKVSDIKSMKYYYYL
jgi:hypothetical protein